MNQQPSATILAQLKPRSKAARFRLYMPAIESKIRDGVGHAQIREALAELGLELTPATYFNYLKRSRHRAQKANPPAVRAGLAAGEALQPKRPEPPRKFDYDPRGIPDLLK